MPSLSWNEVRDRAIRFAREWQDETREEAEAKSFWDGFFDVFGLSRRAVASFEVAVRNIRGQYGFIDLFWPGVMLAEHKSAGKDLSKAESQAFAYIRDLMREGRTDELPRYIILSDFARVVIYDLEPDDQRDLPLFDQFRVAHVEFPLQELHKHVREFAFIKGERSVRLDPQDPANEKAYQIMAGLHDALTHGGLAGHELERLLVRVLFCLFAEDTGIYEPNAFLSFLENRTQPDGSDLGAQLNRLFDVLNTPEDRRSPHLDEDLAGFPYINGQLFAERLGFVDFNSDMRNALLGCCRFQWARISPAVFGSLFQGVMEDKARRQQGAHYTSERDIMKVVRSLFLDDLRAEFEQIKADRSSRHKTRIEDFHHQLASLRFLDPACGCGNFLVITYRELRLLELDVLRLRFKGDARLKLDLRAFCRVDVDQFWGIEISEWAALIAEVAMWLLDHQMNVQVAETFGEPFLRLPLKKSPHLHCVNALRADWKRILPPRNCSYVLGNPPFVGKKEQSAEQKADLDLVWSGVKGAGILDYVTCWYRKAAEYLHGTHVRCAFVSTNSITQGEQVGLLWSELFSRWHLKIHFAHRTFAWESEARGKAHVHVVIIGFAAFDTANKRIYDHEGRAGSPLPAGSGEADTKRRARSDAPCQPVEKVTVSTAVNINPYLLAGADTTVRTRTRPVNGAPDIFYGSMMIDKDRQAGDEAGLILTMEHRDALLAECPALRPFIRRLMGGDEFLNRTERWCLWLVDAPPELPSQSPLLKARIAGVRAFREKSGRPQTRALASRPALFGEIRQPKTPYLLIPKVSSENRRYIPIGFLKPQIIASGSALIVPDATLFHFGILSSVMHNAWMRCVAGRLESRYQYSNNIVYNNFPWPERVLDKNRQAVETAAKGVLETRKEFPNSTLATLYNELQMPPALTKAHVALDRAVDRCYRKERFVGERQRVEFLFALYEKLTAPLLPAAQPKRAGKAKPLYRVKTTAMPPAQSGEEPPAGDYPFFFVREEPPPYKVP